MGGGVCGDELRNNFQSIVFLVITIRFHLQKDP